MLPKKVTAEVTEKLQTLPNSPGVYLFKDAAGTIVYVGKARSLRSRVRSYFLPGTSDTRYFIERIHRDVHDLETYVVKTEKEAALLENQLIKKHLPRYNVQLKDDKEFLSLRIDTKAQWPRLEVVRRPKPDGARYFGPYNSASSARKTLRLINRAFQLRTCRDAELKSRTRPCLQYQIKRCPGPCVLDIDHGNYRKQVRAVSMFLDGRHTELTRELKREMKGASVAQQYETAAAYRDQIQAIEKVHEGQNVTMVTGKDQDAIGIHTEGDQGEISVLNLRQGRLSAVHTFALKGVALPQEELIASFLWDHYVEGRYVPHEILLPVEMDAQDGWAEVLSDRRGSKVEVLTPQRGSKTRIIDLANKNAHHAFGEKQRAKQDAQQRLEEIQTHLKLPQVPHLMECIDISHLGGEGTVAAIVAMKDCQLDKSQYRSLSIQNIQPGDDYAAIFNALSRRFHRGKKGDAGWKLPDLLIVDGGKGQLSMALEALKALQLDNVPVVGLAKEKQNAIRDKVVDRVYLPGQKNPITIQSGGASLRLLCLLRDEAHRFSNLHREKRNTKRRTRSALDEIPGVGKITRTKLLKALGSVQAIAKATPEQLTQAGANQTQASAILNYLQPSPHQATDAEKAENETDAIQNAFDVS